MRLRGVVFDLFHTLTGPESEWGKVFSSDALGIDRKVWDSALHGSSRWRLAGEERDPYRILRRLTDLIDPSIPDDEVRTVAELRVRRFRMALDNIPEENVDALRELRLRGLRLGLVTNADASEMLGWKKCRLCGLFDAEILSYAVGWVKPERQIFEACLDALVLPASECLYVGDGGSDELVAARSLGFTTVFVSGIIRELWPDRIPERKSIAHHHIEELPGIVALVDRIRQSQPAE